MPVTPAPNADLIAVILHFEHSEWDAIKEAVADGSPLDYIHDATMDCLRRDEGVRVVLAQLKDAPTRAELLTGLALSDD